MIGCLGLSGLLLFLGAWMSAFVLYVYFGPANPLLAFAFGAAMVAVFWIVARQFADRAVANDVRGNALRAARERDPNHARNRFVALYIGRGIGWIITLFFGGLAVFGAILGIYDYFADGGESARSVALLAWSAAAIAYYVFPLAKVRVE